MSESLQAVETYFMMFVHVYVQLRIIMGSSFDPKEQWKNRYYLLFQHYRSIYAELS